MNTKGIITTLGAFFYTTIMSFNFDRESLSHCPKSYFDAIFNYYEVAQMLIKFCYILLC